MKDHHFCDLCKKLGKKIINKGRFVNMPEFEVYKDYDHLKKHYKKEHFFCDKSTDYCQSLVFETGP